MNKFTPGPWRKHDGYIYGSNHRTVVLRRSMTPDPEINKEVVATENLILAAPDLYSACVEAIRQLKQTGADPEDYEEITAALKKAQGKAV